MEFKGEIFDFRILLTWDYANLDLFAPIEYIFYLVELFEINFVLLEGARLDHDRAAECLFEHDDIVYDYDDVLS